MAGKLVLPEAGSFESFVTWATLQGFGGFFTTWWLGSKSEWSQSQEIGAARLSRPESER